MKSKLSKLLSVLCLLSCSSVCYAQGYPYDSYDNDRYRQDDYRRQRDSDERYEMERERDAIERERDRLADERDRLSRERAAVPTQAPRVVESCPAGFSPSEQKCSSEERRRGCKDMRLPGGLGCVRR